MKFHAATFAVLFNTLSIAWPSTAQANGIYTYTIDADFDRGILNGVNHNPPNNNQLQISLDVAPSIDPYLWVANYRDETVTKIDTRTGGQVGKYHSALMRNWDGSIPDVPTVGDGCNSPSRTTVDADGNAFVANRGLCNDSAVSTIASLTKIAGKLGHCVDRNGNGRIDTSHDANGDGKIAIDSANEFFGQSDECLLWTKNYAERGDLGRSVALDAEQNLWVGGYSTSKLYKLSGKTGEVLQRIDPNAETQTKGRIYGLAVGPDGFIYTSDFMTGDPLPDGLLRKIDPKAPPGKHVVATVKSEVPTYGIAVDRKGIVWLGNYSTKSQGGIVRVDFTSQTIGLMSVPLEHCSGYTRGVAVDALGNVWAACGGSHKLLKFNSTGVFQGSVSTGEGTLGVAIDHQERVWTANQVSNSLTVYDARRCDPKRPCDGYPKTYEKKAGGDPYSYWDLTGFQLLNSTMGQGVWTVDHDSERRGTKWGTIRWNQEPSGATPVGTSIAVRVFAADDTDSLKSPRFVEVTQGKSFSQEGVNGRYLRVEATLRTERSARSNISPVLSDLTVIPSFTWGDVVKITCEPVGDKKCDPDESVPLDHRAVLLKSGQVFIVGGGYTEARLFDPLTRKWTKTTSAPLTYKFHTATLLTDGQVLVAGGKEGVADASAYLYDPVSAQWSTTASMGQARAHHTATRLADGRVLVVGGEASGLSASAELYDPSKKTWSNTGSLNQGRSGHTATLLENGNVLVVGGNGTGKTPLQSAEVYQAATGTWVPTEPMTQSRSEHTATRLADNRVIVVGNQENSDGAATTELYDPATNAWTRGADMIQKRSKHQATLLQTGQVLVSGGFHKSDGILKTAELYDPVTGTWNEVGSMNIDRYSHTLTLLGNGEVLAAGGYSNYNNNDGQKTSELFLP